MTLTEHRNQILGDRRNITRVLLFLKKMRGKERKPSDILVKTVIKIYFSELIKRKRKFPNPAGTNGDPDTCTGSQISVCVCEALD